MGYTPQRFALTTYTRKPPDAVGRQTIMTLTERFGRRDLLINEHIDHLLALPPVKSSADVDKLRLLYDKVQFRVSALTGLGVSPDQYNVVLNRVLMRCLPDDLAILYRQKPKEAAQDTSGIATPEERARQVAEMLSFLRIQIEVREEGRPGRTPSAFSRFLPDEDVEPPSAPTGHLPTASALAAESVPITEEVCRLCSSCQHTIADCNVQLSAEEKRARLRTARCCYRCGWQNHIARFCRRARSIICSKCNRRHLTILCELFTPAASTRANATTVNQDEPRIAGRGTNTPWEFTDVQHQHCAQPAWTGNRSTLRDTVATAPKIMADRLGADGRWFVEAKRRASRRIYGGRDFFDEKRPIVVTEGESRDSPSLLRRTVPVQRRTNPNPHGLTRPTKAHSSAFYFPGCLLGPSCALKKPREHTQCAPSERRTTQLPP
ncbi:hypothetical protein HPB52_003705 [Rhipicephalus sanguineus]|uniref:CCHC-type domain-containing protein n=1 Tax=Rhipicephalus sanguineus TaxID=34632 RepID=A0A9D4T4V8_RHISA|nr:hypothetical protein HPB52_003705 [Rhipicephalus sanguineus]